MATDPKAPSSSLPAPDLAPPGDDGHQPFLWCSDCRAPLRPHYYALDDRPICGKCRVGYAAKIARGTGPQAMWRAVVYGLVAALGGAAVLGIIIQTIGFGRILLAIAIGFAVAKAINHATGDYLGLRYRIIAVVFTYFAIGLGSLAPVLIALTDLPEELAVAETSTVEDASETGEEDDEYAGSLDMEMETLAEIEEEFEQQEFMERTTQEQRAAAELARASLLEAAATVLMLILVLPLLSLFTFGIYGAVVGLLALGYGIYKAWELTGRCVDYTLSGPYRVGTGPIPYAR